MAADLLTAIVQAPRLAATVTQRQAASDRRAPERQMNSDHH